MKTEDLLRKLLEIGGEITGDDHWCSNELNLSIFVNPRKNLQGFVLPKAIFGQSSCRTDVDYARALYRVSVLVEDFNIANRHRV